MSINILLYKTLIVVILLEKIVFGFDNVQSLNDRLIPTQSPHNSPNSDSCVGQCAFSFIDKMNSQLNGVNGVPIGILNLNYNDFLRAFSNSTFFEQFCNMYHSFSQCYMQCPYGYMQELLQRSSEIVDHFCVYNYKAIKEKFGCLSKLDSNVSKTCLKTCTSHHNAVTSLMHNFKQLALDGDPSRAENYLAESCEYVICTLHCDVPTIAHICNFDTANLIINLTKKSFETMQKMGLDTGAISKWPALCTDIRNYALPMPINNPPNLEFDQPNVIAQSPVLNDQMLNYVKAENLANRLNHFNTNNSSTVIFNPIILLLISCFLFVEFLLSKRF